MLNQSENTILSTKNRYLFYKLLMKVVYCTQPKKLKNIFKISFENERQNNLLPQIGNNKKEKIKE